MESALGALANDSLSAHVYCRSVQEGEASCRPPGFTAFYECYLRLHPTFNDVFLFSMQCTLMADSRATDARGNWRFPAISVFKVSS